MNTPLYPYQFDVLDPIAAGDPVYLGFDPGLGKSRTALEAAKARGVGRMLIVSPASGRYVWERECKKWWPEKGFREIRSPADLSKLYGNSIYLITYGLLSQKDSPYASVIAKGQPFDMTVLDEAAYLKNSATNRTKAVLGKMLPKLGYVLPMSGTPAPNHAGELYPVLKAVYPKALVNTTGRIMTEFEFQDAFCMIANKRFGMGGTTVRVIEGSRNLPALRERMKGFMRRVKKEDVLKDLPPIRWDVIPVQPSERLLVEVPPDMSDDELLKWLSGAGGDHVMRIRRLLGIAKVGGSVEYINEFFDSAPPNRKALVFAYHREAINLLVTGLADYHPAVVTGSTSGDMRAKEIDKFLNDPKCRVFVGNIQAAGTALTLVGPKCHCSDVFFVEASYAVGDNVQAAARVHRIGQKEAVVARMLTAHGTIDDRIQDILARKAGDFNQLFN